MAWSATSACSPKRKVTTHGDIQTCDDCIQVIAETAAQTGASPRTASSSRSHSVASFTAQGRAIGNCDGCRTQRSPVAYATAKTDLASPHPEHLSISAKEGQGLEDLHYALTASISEALSSNNTVVTNARHHAALMAAQTSLMDVLNGLAINITDDFLSIDIRKALHHLGEITGEVTHEDLLDFIFSRFCIGK